MEILLLSLVNLVVLPLVVLVLLYVVVRRAVRDGMGDAWAAERQASRPPAGPGVPPDRT